LTYNELTKKSAKRARKPMPYIHDISAVRAYVNNIAKKKKNHYEYYGAILSQLGNFRPEF